MSLGLRADPTNTSAVISVAGTDQVVITNASNVVATTFTGALAGNAATATALSTSTGVAPSYGCRAWVNFDGTRDTSGAVSTANTNRLIRDSGNVASVLRLGLGAYTVSFTIPMVDANYSTVVLGDGPINVRHCVPFVGPFWGPYNQNSFDVSFARAEDSAYRADPALASVSVFR